MELLLNRQRWRRHTVLALVLLGLPIVAVAQTDEIQVYDAAIADQGIFNLMLHTNFTPIGRKTADFPGGIIPNHSVNGALEWAYGVADWFEQGLYLPVESAYSQGRGGSINGFKLRELFVRPHAEDHKFFYGVNFEFSVNYLYWEPRHVSSEVRPIVVWQGSAGDRRPLCRSMGKSCSGPPRSIHSAGFGSRVRLQFRAGAWRSVGISAGLLIAIPKKANHPCQTVKADPVAGPLNSGQRGPLTTGSCSYLVLVALAAPSSTVCGNQFFVHFLGVDDNSVTNLDLSLLNSLIGTRIRRLRIKSETDKLP